MIGLSSRLVSFYSPIYIINHHELCPDCYSVSEDLAQRLIPISPERRSISLNSSAVKVIFLIAPAQSKTCFELDAPINAVVTRPPLKTQAAGVQGASSHSGRRQFVTKLADQGINARLVQTLARHKHLSTTQRYIDVNENALRNAVDAINF